MTIREKINYLEALEEVINDVESKIKWYGEDDEYNNGRRLAFEKIKSVLEKAAC